MLWFRFKHGSLHNLPHFENSNLGQLPQGKGYLFSEGSEYASVGAFMGIVVVVWGTCLVSWALGHLGYGFA